MNNDLITIYYFGCEPLQVRTVVVESLLEGLTLCGEPLYFNNDDISRLNKIRNLCISDIPKYTKEKRLCLLEAF